MSKTNTKPSIIRSRPHQGPYDEMDDKKDLESLEEPYGVRFNSQARLTDDANANKV